MGSRRIDIDQAAKSFLEGGSLPDLDAEEFAVACDRHIRQVSQQSLSDARHLAERFVHRVRGKSKPLRLMSYRGLARTTHMAGRHAEAERAYLHARRLANGDKRVIGSIDRALIDVYMYLNKFDKSRQRARKALQTFRELKSEADVAMTQVNYGNLLHRQDRHRDAEKLYREAAEYFERSGNELAVARCLYNRANTLVQLFDFAPAAEAYARAEQIYTAHDFTLDATDARYGLAWLHMLEGKFHIALTELADCERRYREASHDRGVALCELDRAEVFLGLNLFSDAYDSAHRALAWFTGAGLRYESSKAYLFAAKAALALGRRSESRRLLKKAHHGFKLERNAGFLGAAHLTAAQIAKDSSQMMKALRAARSRFQAAQLPLWEAVCDLHIAGQSTRPDAALKRLAGNRAAERVPHLYAGWQTILGERKNKRGETQAARQHWRQAADRLDEVRAQLPPVELRSSFSYSDHNPHLHLISSEMTDSPRQAAAWSERYKTAGLWSPLTPLTANPDRRRVEQSLIDLAQQVAALSSQLRISGGERGGTAAEAGRIAKLQRQVRDDLARLETTDAASGIALDDILQSLNRVARRQPVVQFHIDRDEVAAFVHEHDTTRLVRYPDGHKRLSQMMRQWRFLLETESLAPVLGMTVSRAEERKFFETLGNWLWAPLELGSNVDRVLVIPEGELANMPWGALRYGGNDLIERHQFVVSPSLRHHEHALGVRTRSRRMELFAGPSDDLPAVRRELAGLRQKAGDRATVHDPCRRADWPTTGSARIWHYAGHAQLRTDNPFYSYLQLADGPLFAADFRLRQVRVYLTSLAACRSGEQVALPGEESTGLVRSLLEMGSRNVLAGHWPVADRSTAQFMAAFYEAFFDGKSLLQAQQFAAKAVRETHPGAYYWAAFSIFGAGV